MSRATLRPTPCGHAREEGERPHSTHGLYALEQRSSQRSLPTPRNPWRLGCKQWSLHRLPLTLSDVGSLTAPSSPFLHRCSVPCPVSRFASHCWHTSLWRVQDIPSILVHFWTLLFTVYTAHYYGDSVTLRLASCRRSHVPSRRNVLARRRCPIHALECVRYTSSIAQGVPRAKSVPVAHDGVGGQTWYRRVCASTTGHWDSGNPALTLSRRRCRAVPYTSSDTPRFPTTLLLDSGVLGFHAVHKSPLIYKVIEKEGL